MDISLVSRIAVAVLLGVSAIAKWVDLGWFARVVASYRLVPRKLTGLAALAIALSETALAALLLSGQLVAPASWAAFGLVLLFSIAVVANLLRGRNDLDCGCAGPQARTKISWSGVVRNLGIAQLCLLSALSTTAPDGLEVPLFWTGIAFLAWPTIVRFAKPTRAPSFPH